MKNSKSLREGYPELAAQWHPTKNGDLTPDQVTVASTKKVWWLLSYDDPKSGNHFDFEWTAVIADRTSKLSGCPYLSGNAVWPGFNDLATKYPEIAAQWHPTKNGDLTPDQVTVASNKKVWWLLAYDDPKTGNHFDFEWATKINSRITDNAGCPYLSGKAVWPGFNDLATKNPEIAAQWHPTKNGDLTPDQVTCNSTHYVWWFLPYDDPKTGNHFEFEWKATVFGRIAGNTGCPYLSGAAVWPGFNDLATLYPEIAAQWHPTKNGNLTPNQITCGSQKYVWWFLPYDDPVSGKHFDFEWKTAVSSRIAGNTGCPYLSGRAVWPGFNDLATKYPEIAAQWHPTKNGDLTPERITCGSQQYVWWFLPYDDPVSGKHFDFEWRTKVFSRTIYNWGCPYLSGKAVWAGFNDLATHYPEIAAQWHPTKNRKSKPSNVYKQSRQKVWWLCPECGKEWRTTIYSRTIGGSVCPSCSKRKNFQ